ncbi:Uncharacterised protein [Yersinia similis]|uniref:Uncharacterized protein n=1 Tax=Yersinia similis TaxID=367190 RepID=A0A0T9RB91_9GAMM|nr:Uncharacterised protein [Yersinia similis]
MPGPTVSGRHPPHRTSPPRYCEAGRHRYADISPADGRAADGQGFWHTPPVPADPDRVDLFQSAVPAGAGVWPPAFLLLSAQVTAWPVAARYQRHRPRCLRRTTRVVPPGRLRFYAQSATDGRFSVLLPVAGYNRPESGFAASAAQGPRVISTPECAVHRGLLRSARHRYSCDHFINTELDYD